MIPRISIIGLLAIILGVPFVMSVVNRPPEPPQASRTLLIVTPHIPQIRQEFAEAFERWHKREFGEQVRVDMRTPGGTTEIRGQLDAQFRSEIANGRVRVEGGRVLLEPGAAAYDLMFGGGSYDHAQLARGLKVSQDLFGRSPLARALGLDQLDAAAFEDKAIDTAAVEAAIGRKLPKGVVVSQASEGAAPQLEVTVSISAPAGFSQEQMDAWFGENVIGTQTLYDPEQFWIGTALSSFGIVYNRLICERLGVGVPHSFEDLTDFRYFGNIALADPRQSGSITTTFDSILGYYGWPRGWAVLREMCANARSFTNASTKPPTDVSQGEAAAGLAIDFYGRGQAQAVGGDRVGYSEPTGAVYVDADPISIMNGAPHPDLAKRFVEFVLSEEGQALWQFHATQTAAGADNPIGPDAEPMGPRVYELRRMPVRRVMYEKYLPYLIDQVDPFELASKTSNPGWRTGVQMMMGAFAIDAGDEMKAAWAALNRARAAPDFPAETLAEMERLFYAFPDQAMPDGTVLPFDEKNYRAVRGTWSDLTATRQAEIAYVRFFREQFARIVDLYEQHAR